mmetsp:Transcript_52577/g.87267  ORF Transcript_52577/g.87267 Transcript_52577/m.87267 type:complete len:213 (+) Transcript_52577:375-1013(+)
MTAVPALFTPFSALHSRPRPHLRWQVVVVRRVLDEDCSRFATPRASNPSCVTPCPASRARDRHIRAVSPHLGRLFTIPPPTEHVVARLQVLWNQHHVGDEPNHPVTRARAHSRAVTVEALALQDAVVPRARRREGNATRRRVSRGAGTIRSVEKTGPAVLRAGDRVASPGGAHRPGALVDEDGGGDGEAEGAARGDGRRCVVCAGDGLGGPH